MLSQGPIWAWEGVEAEKAMGLAVVVDHRHAEAEAVETDAAAVVEVVGVVANNKARHAVVAPAKCRDQVWVWEREWEWVKVKVKVKVKIKDKDSLAIHYHPKLQQRIRCSNRPVCTMLNLTPTTTPTTRLGT